MIKAKSIYLYTNIGSRKLKEIVVPDIYEGFAYRIKSYLILAFGVYTANIVKD